MHPQVLLERAAVAADADVGVVGTRPDEGERSGHRRQVGVEGIDAKGSVGACVDFMNSRSHRPGHRSRSRACVSGHHQSVIHPTVDRRVEIKQKSSKTAKQSTHIEMIGDYPGTEVLELPLEPGLVVGLLLLKQVRQRAWPLSVEAM
jgi:hypothetical protein